MAPRDRRGRFQNEIQDAHPCGFLDFLKWMFARDWHQDKPRAQYSPLDYPDEPPPRGDIRAFHIGHATVLFEIDGRRVLADPIWSDHCSPIPNSRAKRLQPPGIPFEQLPPIDVVLISHSHYDHLDKETIRRLGNRPHYVVPLGLKSLLEKWGIEKVIELDWWEDARLAGLMITATPCQHWSKRTPFDANKTLWCSYAVTRGPLRCFFLGDSGYYDGFKRIGERLGPFHVAAIPIGAYEPRWFMKFGHMNPEEAVQAFEDLGAVAMIPIHHGTFRLTDEPLDEPVSRLLNEWERRNLDHQFLWLMRPGEFRCVEDMVYIPPLRMSSGEHRITNSSSEVAAEPKSEWGIAVCLHKGEMVDLEAFGHHTPGDETATQVLWLDYLSCSGYGDLDICKTPRCPLRDPAFLKAHGIHGILVEGSRLEVFEQVDASPSPDWFSRKLKIVRKSDP